MTYDEVLICFPNEGASAPLVYKYRYMGGTLGGNCHPKGDNIQLPFFDLICGNKTQIRQLLPGSCMG